MPVVTFGLRPADNVASWEDTYINQEFPASISPGGINTLYISQAVVAREKKTIVKIPGLKTYFDGVGSVTINSASLVLTRRNNVAGPDRTGEVRRLIVDNNVLQSTWNNRLTGIAWGAAGAAGAGDVNATVLATGTITATISANTFTGAGLASWVADIANNVYANDGLLIATSLPGTIGSGDFDFRSGDDATTASRPYLSVDYTVNSTVNWTINSPTVNSDAGTVTLTVTLDAPAPGGGFSGLVNTYDITAVAGVDYTAQVDVPFSISAGNTTGNIVIPILP